VRVDDLREAVVDHRQAAVEGIEARCVEHGLDALLLPIAFNHKRRAQSIDRLEALAVRVTRNRAILRSLGGLVALGRCTHRRHGVDF
jgi:hypothetical protein